jgi:uncharacterized protein (DUF934 family)
MALLRADLTIADRWTRIADEAPIPAAGAALVTRARLDVEAEHLWHRPDGLGVELSSADAVEDLEDWLPHLQLVAFRFPAFTDGRPFSAARLLRSRYGFKGEIRAIGPVLADQRQFLLQCGFDSFEITDPRILASWEKADVWMPVTYQPEYSETLGPRSLSVLRARHSRPAVAAA